MKKIFLVGNCPLPNENTKTRPAAGLRTFQFLKPLLGKFDVKLATIAMPECYQKEPKKTYFEHGDFSQLIISKNDPKLISEIQKGCNEFKPDAIVSVNTYPSYIACLLKTDAPIWADLNGWIMAEAQAQAYKMGANDFLPHYKKIEETILKRADKFSSVSKNQKYAILGELALTFRLNKESFGYDFVNHIPNATEWFEGEKNVDENYDLGVPSDSFVLLWMGGYNTWVDEATLFKGVEAAMAKCENLYFVSTGGDIKGLDNKTFAKFKKMTEESKLKKRFVFLGWVDTKDIPYIYGRADAGVNVDRKCAETYTGARNRLNEMMKFGLPVITTLGSEISYEVERSGAGITVESEKHEELAEAIVRMYEMWKHGADEFFEFGKNGVKYAEELTYERAIAPLLDWLKNPSYAPDRGIKLGKTNFSGGIRYLRENGLRKFLKKILSLGSS